MKRYRWLRVIVTLSAALLVGCAAPAAPQRDEGPSPVTSGRTLTMVLRYEVNDLASKIPGGSSPVITKRLFNAYLALIDGVGVPRAYLAEALPQLNTDSWRVFPDGRMETAYRLRDGLTWHDGSPLTAEDFAFAFRVYTAPGLGVFIPAPQNQMESVSALDPRTVLVRWRVPYPDANALHDGDLDPLPLHLLQEPFAAYEQDHGTRDSLLNQPFWTTQYVGAGPFRLERWDQSSQLEGAAFKGHALGQPKIDRILVRIVADENTVLSQVLAGDADFTADFTLRFEHARILQREWEAQGKGKVILKRSSPVTLTIQLRPEYVAHPAQLDVRVRRAMAHAIDRASLNDGLFEGQGFVTENLVPDDVPYFADVDRAFSPHAYDPQRAEELMRDAGFVKDSVGFFANPQGERFKTEYRVIAGPEFERGQAILVDTWRRAGFDVASTVLPANLVRDVQFQHVFPGMATRGGGTNERTWASAAIGAQANGWVGDNRAGWSNAEYDRLLEAFSSSLDHGERVRQVVQMHRLTSENLPHFMLYHAIQVNTRVADLTGPEAGTAGSGTFTPGTLPHWNIQGWELR